MKKLFLSFLFPLFFLLFFPTQSFSQAPVGSVGTNAIIYFHADHCIDNVNASYLSLCEDLDDGQIWTCVHPENHSDNTRCNFGDEWISNSFAGMEGDAGVLSWNSRAGIVSPASGDYSATQITALTPGTGVSSFVQTILNSLFTSQTSTQSSLTSHINLTNPHGATTDNSQVNSIVLRDSVGSITPKIHGYTLGGGTQPPACSAGTKGTIAFFSNGVDTTDCSVGGGDNFNFCGCNGSEYSIIMSGGGGGGGGGSLQSAYLASGTSPQIDFGANGLKLVANSLGSSLKICNTLSSNCANFYMNDSGDFVQTFLVPMNWITKIFSGMVAKVESSTGTNLAEVSNSGVVKIAALTATGAAGGSKVLCINSSTGVVHSSSTGTDCSN